MPYLPNVNSYLHQSALLLQAYPTTTRITTKYSLPRKRKTKLSVGEITGQPDTSSDTAGRRRAGREHQTHAATLTIKTYETTSGICLKYETNKSAEVGRLMTGLGKLAKGEITEEPSVPAVGVETIEAKTEQSMDITAMPAKMEKVPEAVGGGGKAKKKKGKK
ncbi:hypothetical protein EPUS_08282 [Endocarpon pusillum Z07020]|uniref:SRP9 domain-containing protein n=1 Tax=Endocarpon pusillum (strain Z07020 / HMAS-L-300199) TaxID=1263415 RepID=U1HS35_ENDPU|nr:uncharacterized protein EPUS_08282 [Endocarpon pusillum Z07020]ERF73340.1 hypothetical protein EPUS_08282 [Endocarpon pusillum Z07020]